MVKKALDTKDGVITIKMHEDGPEFCNGMLNLDFNATLSDLKKINFPIDSVKAARYFEKTDQLQKELQDMSAKIGGRRPDFVIFPDAQCPAKFSTRFERPVSLSRALSNTNKDKVGSKGTVGFDRHSNLVASSSSGNQGKIDNSPNSRMMENADRLVCKGASSVESPRPSRSTSLSSHSHRKHLSVSRNLVRNLS